MVDRERRANDERRHRPPKFPPEIIDTIIHHFHEDRSALIKCSEISRSFIPASRYHLFREINVQNSNVADLVSLLDSPLSTINRHIQSVTLSGVRARRYEAAHIKRILTLPAVTMLVLRWLKWQNLPEDTRSYILDGLPTLTTLRLQSFDFQHSSQFLDLLRACPALLALELLATDFHDFSACTPLLPTNSQLKKLYIGGMQDTGFDVRILDRLLASADAMRLDSFRIGPLERQHMDKAWEVVQTYKPFLKDFVVSFSSEMAGECNFSYSFIISPG